MVRQAGFFDLEELLRELSAKGDDLERIAALVDFALFRPALGRAVPRADGTKGGQPAFDLVLMFKILWCRPCAGCRTSATTISSRIGSPACTSSASGWPIRYRTPT